MCHLNVNTRVWDAEALRSSLLIGTIRDGAGCFLHRLCSPYAFKLCTWAASPPARPPGFHPPASFGTARSTAPPSGGWLHCWSGSSQGRSERLHRAVRSGYQLLKAVIQSSENSKQQQQTLRIQHPKIIRCQILRELEN